MVQGVVPDIVTMGKAMGNGYPVSCVATSQELSDAFSAGPSYFNTFGGATGACASALAVLQVLEAERLQEQACAVGKYMLDKLKTLMNSFPQVVGDVRGRGLMIGIDVVESEDGKPSPARSQWISEHIKAQHRVRSLDLAHCLVATTKLL
jgi:ethanolamine-phosphate phospho-lyase